MRGDAVGRARDVSAELDAAYRAADGLLAAPELAPGALPRRVVHNDCKLNNLLLDDRSGEALCVVDLDTVMPGTVLFDFGELARTGACPAAEDERDLARVRARPGAVPCARVGLRRGRARAARRSRDPRARARGPADGARERRALPDRSPRRATAISGSRAPATTSIARARSCGSRSACSRPSPRCARRSLGGAMIARRAIRPAI